MQCTDWVWMIPMASFKLLIPKGVHWKMCWYLTLKLTVLKIPVSWAVIPSGINQFFPKMVWWHTPAMINYTSLWNDILYNHNTSSKTINCLITVRFKKNNKNQHMYSNTLTNGNMRIQLCKHNWMHGLSWIFLCPGTLIYQYVSNLKVLNAYEKNSFEKLKLYVCHIHLFSAQIIRLAFYSLICQW